MCGTLLHRCRPEHHTAGSTMSVRLHCSPCTAIRMSASSPCTFEQHCHTRPPCSRPKHAPGGTTMSARPRRSACSRARPPARLLASRLACMRPLGRLTDSCHSSCHPAGRWPPAPAVTCLLRRTWLEACLRRCWPRRRPGRSSHTGSKCLCRCGALLHTVRHRGHGVKYSACCGAGKAFMHMSVAQRWRRSTRLVPELACQLVVY
jgi:hypothetical protein